MPDNDVFRKEYKEITDTERGYIFDTKTLAEQLYDQFDAVVQEVDFDPRSLAVAKTKLEESIMWFVKSITK